MALLAAYSFDEASGNVLDASGNGHDFALGASGARGTGHTGSAATKSGAGFVPLPTALRDAVNGSANRTIMAWLKGNGAAWYVRCQHTSIDSGGWGIVTLDGGSTIGIRARNAGGENHSSIAIPAGGADWYHIAGTYDGTNLRTYINGSLVDTRALTAPLRSDADSLDMMEWTNNATLVDDLRFHDTALDQATISALMSTPVTPAAPEVPGTATGDGGGVGAATGVREVVAAATGAAGGIGSAAGAPEDSGDRLGAAAGTGGGVGVLTGVRERVGTATGDGGGWGAVYVQSELLPAPVASIGSSGWGSLLAILHEAREVAESDSTPVACPNDGEPLSAGPDGVLYCSYDGWRPGDV